ncbi:MAG: hypothetical protein IJ141_03205 [Lachnospiraceae bacterium]|nr:hypothetical protein [Lachnospiraceae bacterium]
MDDFKYSTIKKNIPSICLDFKQNRIRIHKHTLHMLNNPTSLNIIINPSLKIIGFGKCPSNDPLAVKVYPSHFEPDNCYEIYSLKFLKKILSLCKTFDTNHSYRISGSLKDDLGFAFFYLDEAIPIDEVDE